MIRWTTRRPVYGREHSSTILYEPSLATCSIKTMTLPAPWTRSMAPPMPLINLPGTIQFAMSPSLETCIAPRIAASTFPLRIMANDVAESKYEAPGLTVTVSLPAVDQVRILVARDWVGTDDRASHATGVGEDVRLHLGRTSPFRGSRRPDPRAGRRSVAADGVEEPDLGRDAALHLARIRYKVSPFPTASCLGGRNHSRALATFWAISVLLLERNSADLPG
jgi:hypothetical protein